METPENKPDIFDQIAQARELLKESDQQMKESRTIIERIDKIPHNGTTIGRLVGERLLSQEVPLPS